jgi:hypothetical protein
MTTKNIAVISVTDIDNQLSVRLRLNDTMARIQRKCCACMCGIYVCIQTHLELLVSQDLQKGHLEEENVTPKWLWAARSQRLHNIPPSIDFRPLKRCPSNIIL